LSTNHHALNEPSVFVHRYNETVFCWGYWLTRVGEHSPIAELFISSPGGLKHFWFWIFVWSFKEPSLLWFFRDAKMTLLWHRPQEPYLVPTSIFVFKRVVYVCICVCACTCVCLCMRTPQSHSCWIFQIGSSCHAAHSSGPLNPSLLINTTAQ
jgi:hypothetical protein